MQRGKMYFLGIQTTRLGVFLVSFEYSTTKALRSPHHKISNTLPGSAAGAEPFIFLVERCRKLKRLKMKRATPVTMFSTHAAKAPRSWKFTSAPSLSSFFTLETLLALAAFINAIPFRSFWRFAFNHGVEKK